MGKGDKRRPAQVPKSVVDDNWARIKRNDARREKALKRTWG